MPQRGPRCKIGYHKLFNYILKVLHTGMQWSELSIDKDAQGLPEIHYTGIFKVYARWARDGRALGARWARAGRALGA